MATGFTDKHIAEYIKETREYFLINKNESERLAG
jgi:hypothetical protein